MGSLLPMNVTGYKHTRFAALANHRLLRRGLSPNHRQHLGHARYLDARPAGLQPALGLVAVEDAARYAGTIGVPACFTRNFFAPLRALDGAQGCKALLRAHAHEAALVDCPEAEHDVDTPADYARLLTTAG